jgi:hypothetical protein
MDVPISTSTTVATRYDLFSTNEQLALAGFLAGYGGLTRDAYLAVDDGTAIRAAVF